MPDSAGRNNPRRGRKVWTDRGLRFIDHGDEIVDEMWRERLAAQEPLQAMCIEDVEYEVPAEYVNSGRVPETWFDCMDILAATTEPEILSD